MYIENCALCITTNTHNIYNIRVGHKIKVLNVQVVSNAKFCVDSKNTTQNVLRQKLTSQPQFL